MTTPRHSRKYDFVLVGATGYTGTLAAEHIARHLPTNLRWAIAGRSTTKLEALRSNLTAINSDRLEPEIELVSVDDEGSLRDLVKQTKVCISVVSYGSAGHHVISACIEEHTDYVDTSGETPMLRKWFDKYQDRAVANGVRLVLSCGMLSGLFDLVAFAAVQGLASRFALSTQELILCATEVPVEISGGTAKAISEAQNEDPEILKASQDPWYLSPDKRGRQVTKLSNGLNLRQDPYLGLLSETSLTAPGNRQHVNRTWGLLSGSEDGPSTEVGYGYGPEFQYNEYTKASSMLDGILRLLISSMMRALLGLGIGALLVKWVSAAPGGGPDAEKSRQLPVRLEAHAVGAVGPGAKTPPRRVRAAFTYTGGPYILTAMLLAEGAASLLYNGENIAIAGGFVTPATIGGDFLERIQKVGASVETSDV